MRRVRSLRNKKGAAPIVVGNVGEPGNVSVISSIHKTSKKPPNVAKTDGKSKRSEEILTVVAPFSSSYLAIHSPLVGATPLPDFSKRLTFGV